MDVRSHFGSRVWLQVEVKACRWTVRGSAGGAVSIPFGPACRRQLPQRIRSEGIAAAKIPVLHSSSSELSAVKTEPNRVEDDWHRTRRARRSRARAAVQAAKRGDEVEASRLAAAQLLLSKHHATRGGGMAPKQAHGEPWKTSQNAWWCVQCKEWVRAKKCNCYLCDRKKPTGKALKLFSSTPEGKAAQKEIDERPSGAPPKAAPKASPKAPVNKTVAILEADLKKKDAELKKKAAETTKLKKSGATPAEPDDDDEEAECGTGATEGKEYLAASIAELDVEIKSKEKMASISVNKARIEAQLAEAKAERERLQAKLRGLHTPEARNQSLAGKISRLEKEAAKNKKAIQRKMGGH